MRVLFNTYPVAFDCPGGGEIQILRTKKFLEKIGVDIELYDLWNPQLNRTDVVHYFSVQGGSINFCSYVKRLGLPLVISPILWLDRDKELYPLDEIRELFKLSDLVLPNSHAEAELLSDFFKIPREKFHITMNAVDETFHKAIPGELFRAKFSINGPFLLNVGNIEVRKNQLNLIRAVKDTGMQIVLLGNIRDRAYFQECLKEGDGFLMYLGYVEHESELLMSAYNACEVFVLPSTLETPGLSALEAAASGTKVVITSIGSTWEYFKNYVTYIDPYNIENIRTGIIKELATIRDESLKKNVIKNFTWDKTALQALEAYTKVLNKVKVKAKSKNK